MANLRIFVSSTCYDLTVVRNQLRSFIEDSGYEPVMSDYNDVTYDPRVHTHSSCIDEVAGCDMVIVVIGPRFGGKVVPQALAGVDIESLKSTSRSIETLKSQENISITQLEVLKAIERSIPIFAFVDERVWQDHATYEKNKHKAIIDSIEFSSIEKPDSAKFIFEFINFLRHRAVNNSVLTYSKYQDIEDSLRRQWSGLYQRLLSEQRTKQIDVRRIDALTEQFEDLKAAILTAVGTKNEREVARGVVMYRRLFDFLRGFDLQDYSFILNQSHTWQEFLDHIKVTDIREACLDRDRDFGPRTVNYLIKDDGTFYELRFPFKIAEISLEWESFAKLDAEIRSIIFEALHEMRVSPSSRYVRYVNRPFDEISADMVREARMGGDAAAELLS